MDNTFYLHQDFEWCGWQGHGAVRLCVVLMMVCAAGYVAQSMPLIIMLLNYTDHHAMVALNYFGNARADHFWWGYSQKLTWVPLALTALATAIHFHTGSWRQKTALVIGILALVALSDQISSGLIKPLVGRLRPSHDPSICLLLHYVGDYRGGMFGFVSGHAANTACVATLLCAVFRDRLTRLALILFAAMMCYSRIYLGVHFPGDTLCGALLGWGIATVAIRRLGHVIGLYSTSRRPTAVLVVLAATVAVLLLG